MRVHDIANSVRLATDLFQLGQDSAILVAYRMKCLCQATPTGKGVFEHIGVRTGIEKNISLWMRD